MSRQPLDKGRVAFVAETYASSRLGQNNQPEMKNRYATMGRATLWPGDNGGAPVTQIELDTIPIGHQGPLKLYIFWDSQGQQNQQGPTGYQGDPGYGYDQYHDQHQGQPPAPQQQGQRPGNYGRQRG